MNGTVNDLAMMGARPLFLSAALILEEGLQMEMLGAVVASMADACRARRGRARGRRHQGRRAGQRGRAVRDDRGHRARAGRRRGRPERARPGDRVIVTGPVGSHGVAVMSGRQGISFEGDLASDSAPLGGLVRGDARGRRRARACATRRAAGSRAC